MTHYFIEFIYPHLALIGSAALYSFVNALTA